MCVRNYKSKNIKSLDTTDVVIALGKAWKRRNRDETVKLLDGIQRG